VFGIRCCPGKTTGISCLREGSQSTLESEHVSEPCAFIQRWAVKPRVVNLTYYFGYERLAQCRSGSFATGVGPPASLALSAISPKAEEVPV